MTDDSTTQRERPTYADYYIEEHLGNGEVAVARCRRHFRQIQNNEPDAMTYAEYARLQREAEHASKELARVALQVQTLLVSFYNNGAKGV